MKLRSALTWIWPSPSSQRIHFRMCLIFAPIRPPFQSPQPSMKQKQKRNFFLSLFFLSFRPIRFVVLDAHASQLPLCSIDTHRANVFYSAGHQVVTGYASARATKHIRMAKEEEWKCRRKAVNILQPIRMKYVAWLFALLLLLLLWHTSFIINAEREIISALRLIYVRRSTALPSQPSLTHKHTQPAHAM